jgi:hypothetical protein
VVVRLADDRDRITRREVVSVTQVIGHRDKVEHLVEHLDAARSDDATAHD